MLKAVFAILVSGFILAAGPASAQQAPDQRGKPVSIPLLGGGAGSIRTFEPTRNGDGIYIQSFRRDWYLASFSTRCPDLTFASAIAFKSFNGM